jgi:hypothetical protein
VFTVLTVAVIFFGEPQIIPRSKKTFAGNPRWTTTAINHGKDWTRYKRTRPAERPLAQVQNQPLAGVRDWRLYRRQSVRCVDLSAVTTTERCGTFQRSEMGSIRDCAGTCMRFLGLVETECCPFHKFAGGQTLTLGTDSNKRGNGKVPLAAAQAYQKAKHWRLMSAWSASSPTQAVTVTIRPHPRG